MSIQSFIRKVCTQDAVYWEFKGVDGYSNPQYKEARGIKVRWDEKSELIADQNGKEIVSNAQLLVPHDLKEQSRVKLIHLHEIPIEPDAEDYEDAYEIKKVDRHPTFRSKTLDIFIAYL